MAIGHSFLSMGRLGSVGLAPNLLLALMMVVLIPAALLIGAAVFAGLILYAAIIGVGRLIGRAGRLLPRRDGRENVRVIAPGAAGQSAV